MRHASNRRETFNVRRTPQDGSSRLGTHPSSYLTLGRQSPEVEAQRHLARQVGRPDCSFSRSAPHRLGGSGSHAGEGLRLLLMAVAAFRLIIDLVWFQQ
jgi:hypothetical protein